VETTNIVDFARRDEMTDALTDLLRTGAQQLIATAVEAEFAGYLAQFADLRTEAGHAAVVRNGHHPERPFQTGIGPVSVRIPKVRSKDGTPVTFRSALVPPYVRRTKTLEAALPWLYLKGISSGEMAPVFVKQVVRRFHAASLISGALISVSGLSQTGPAGCQLRVFPDQRCGFCARAFA